MLNLTRRQFWIFDLDGTITRPIHDFVAIRKTLGIPAEADILGFITAQPKKLRDRLHRQLSAIEIDLARRARANSGACELLECLHARQRKLAILTRNQRNCVAVSLERLGVASLFAAQAVVASEDAMPKPDPEGVFKLLEYWQAAPDDCVIVGDYLYDLQVGHRAGIATVHYAANREDRWPDYTDWLIEDFAELLEAFSGERA